MVDEIFSKEEKQKEKIELASLQKYLTNRFISLADLAKNERVDAWMNTTVSYGTALVTGKMKLLVLNFIEKYRPFVEAMSIVDNPFTSLSESLHSHHLRFFTKKIFRKRGYPTKILYSILSWNEEPQWLIRVIDLTKGKLHEW